MCGSKGLESGQRTTGKDFRNNPECSHRAGNRVCSYRPERETSQCKGIGQSMYVEEFHLGRGKKKISRSNAALLTLDKAQKQDLKGSHCFQITYPSKKLKSIYRNPKISCTQQGKIHISIQSKITRQAKKNYYFTILKNNCLGVLLNLKFSLKKKLQSFLSFFTLLLISKFLIYITEQLVLI